MCGRTVVVSKVEIIEKVFQVKANKQLEKFKPSYNLSIGQLSPVVLSENKHELTLAKFGLTPAWAKKEMYLFNARSEGDGNKENSPSYTGGMGIINKPSFRNLIRNRRCLVIADAFYEGSEKEGLSKPYLFYVKDRRPFAFAGLYDKWLNQETGEEVLSYTIITTWANKLLAHIGHHRSPVILSKNAEHTWLRENAPLSHITQLLHPFPPELMNGYPVSPEVKSPKNNSKELVEPLGQRLIPETTIQIKEEYKTEGMGERKETRRWKKR